MTKKKIFVIVTGVLVALATTTAALDVIITTSQMADAAPVRDRILERYRKVKAAETLEFQPFRQFDKDALGRTYWEAIHSSKMKKIIIMAPDGVLTAGMNVNKFPAISNGSQAATLKNGSKEYYDSFEIFDEKSREELATTALAALSIEQKHIDDRGTPGILRLLRLTRSTFVGAIDVDLGETDRDTVVGCATPDYTGSKTVCANVDWTKIPARFSVYAYPGKYYLSLHSVDSQGKKTLLAFAAAPSSDAELGVSAAAGEVAAAFINLREWEGDDNL